MILHRIDKDSYDSSCFCLTDSIDHSLETAAVKVDSSFFDNAFEIRILTPMSQGREVKTI